MLDDLLHIPKFEPIVTVTLPVAPGHPVPSDIYQYSESSVSLKNWVIARFSAQLFASWSTVVAMRLVVNGHASDFSTAALMRLFDLAVVALEPCDTERLKTGHFPFLIGPSPIDDDYPCNALNFGLEGDAVTAVRIISQLPEFGDWLKAHIEDRNREATAHLLDSLHPNVSIFAPQSTTTLDISVPSGDVMLISTPAFNSITGIRKRRPQFPVVVEGRSFTFQIPGSIDFPITALAISSHCNQWLYGTSFRLLLLLKYCSDPIFVRSILIENLVTQSPFIAMFIPELLLTAAQQFITRDSMSPNYRRLLLTLASFLHDPANDTVDQSLLVFFHREVRSIKSELPMLLSPFFPEFTSVTTEIDNKIVNIAIPEASLPIQDHFGLFLCCKALFLPSRQLKAVPFWDILPIWLSVRGMPYVSRQTEDSIVVQNGLRLTCTVRLTVRHHCWIDPVILRDNSATFTDPIELLPPYAFQFADPELHISINSASASIDITVDPVNPIDISAIRDEFVSDIRALIEHWTQANTDEILRDIGEGILSEGNFDALRPIIARSALTARFSERALLLVSYYLYNLNCLWVHHRHTIPAESWQPMMPCISTQATAEQFMASIVKGRDSDERIVVNRHVAQRMIADGTGRQSNSIIAQVARWFLRRRPEKLRGRKQVWRVKFEGEEAIDAGGPRTELFAEIAGSIFQPTSHLFVIVPNGRNTIGRNRNCFVPSSNLSQDAAESQYRAIGIFIGIVIRTGNSQALPFAPLVWKFIANQPIEREDIFEVDDNLKTQIGLWESTKNDADFTRRFGIRWEVVNWRGGMNRLQNAPGSDLVTGHQLGEYTRRYIRSRIDEIEPYLIAMRQGFHQNIGFSSHPSMSGALLSFLCQGSPALTTDELRRVAIFSGFEHGRDPALVFGPAVERMSDTQRFLLLKFITG
jgi:hypothetical protein